MSTISDRLSHAQQEFNAVISTISFNEDAVDSAPTLRGLPIAFKDIVDIAEVPTTCGTNVDTGPVPTKNATVAQRLMDAGAIPVAKANLQEFSYGILGDASAYGRVINPRDPQVCGGGSSSGSAALVASGALELTVGSDSAGSVRVPAASQGVLGFKPTTGTIPLDGVFPFASSFDCIGFFATSIELIEQALLATVNEEPTPAENVATMDISALTPKGERFAGLLSALQDSTFAAVERLDYSQLESTIATTAKLYAPMRLKEAYDVHQPYLDQRDKYQGVILERVLGGQDITQADYDAAAQQVEQLRTEALALFDASPIILAPTSTPAPSNGTTSPQKTLRIPLPACAAGPSHSMSWAGRRSLSRCARRRPREWVMRCRSSASRARISPSCASPARFRRCFKHTAILRVSAC